MKHLLITGLVLVVGCRVAWAQPDLLEPDIETQINITSLMDEQLVDRATASIEGVLESLQRAFINQSTPEISPRHATQDAEKAIGELWERAPFRCIFITVAGPLVRRSQDNQFEFRGVALHVEAEPGSPHREEGVFVVNAEGQVTDLKFGLETQKYQQILEERTDVADFRHRQIIVDFVDNFRTAYNRKDISYLEDVFSENALIIVGRVVQVSDDRSIANQLNNELGTERVEFIRHSKEEYLARLNEIFQRNEFIKVEFESINVYPHSEIEGIYGVELIQYWHSYSTRQNGYKDEGYLFLMVDVRDIEKIFIHVRTWQPKSATAPDEVINLRRFRLTSQQSGNSRN